MKDGNLGNFYPELMHSDFITQKSLPLNELNLSEGPSQNSLYLQFSIIEFIVYKRLLIHKSQFSIYEKT